MQCVDISSLGNDVTNALSQYNVAEMETSRDFDP